MTLVEKQKKKEVQNWNPFGIAVVVKLSAGEYVMLFIGELSDDDLFFSFLHLNFSMLYIAKSY